MTDAMKLAYAMVTLATEFADLSGASLNNEKPTQAIKEELQKLELKILQIEVVLFQNPTYLDQHSKTLAGLRRQAVLIKERFDQ